MFILIFAFIYFRKKMMNNDDTIADILFIGKKNSRNTKSALASIDT